MASILVSEVDPDVRRLLVTLVERLGHQASVLQDDVVVPPRADVLVVDPIAPSGVEHARLLRAHFRELPVLCLNPVPDDAGFLGHGPTAFLPKPFTPDRLAAALDAALLDLASRDTGFLAGGPTAFLPKPFTPDQLAAAVDAVLASPV